MTTQHTPGPWSVCSFCTPHEDEDPLGVFEVVEIQSQLCKLDEKAQEACFEDDDELEESIRDEMNELIDANARLIAAAPELLAALRAIQARIKGVWDDPDLVQFGGLMENTNSDVIDIAQAAIAKATL